MKTIARGVLYAFPIRLFLLHVKRHPLLLLFWVLLILISSDNFAKAYGGPYLFLSPEYMGQVTSLSYLIVGFALGGFIMTWHTCFYMLNSFRFKFLASLAKPFVTFTHNNFILPLVFNGIYIHTLVQFHQVQGTHNSDIWRYVFSLLLGQALMVVLVVIYFSLFNTNVERFIRGLTDKARENFEAGNIILEKLDPDRPILDKDQWLVETYIYNIIRVRNVRTVDHYDMALIKRVLRQHHINTVLIIILSVSILFAYGLLLDNSIFRIPAGAALLLILSVSIAVFSLINYWSGGWRVMMLVVIFSTLNIISGFDLVVYKHKVLGLDYTQEPLAYSNQAVREHVTPEMVSEDIENTQQVLNRWKDKFATPSNQKPYMVFIQSSGGGLRAAYWGMHVLQKLETITRGELMNHTMLMTGASGGMMGNAFFRQLYLFQKQGKDILAVDSIFREQMGKDMLNAIFSGYATNDLFFPWQTFEDYSQRYRKDRAYWFDEQLIENTKGLLKGKVNSYMDAEQHSLVPMMVFSPTIVNDQRSLFISASPISYLCTPYTGRNRGYLNYILPDAVDYMKFFEGRGAENIDLTTAMRLNATYPYVLPAAYLPTVPDMKVMDAGLRENHGFNVSTRFVNVFKDWIERYTAGVVFIQIRSDVKLQKVDDAKAKSTLINELFLPFKSIYSNFLIQQDYTNDLLVSQLANDMKVPVHILPFIYTPQEQNKEASMTFHLTTKEKQEIVEAYDTEGNANMEKRLLELLRVP